MEVGFESGTKITDAYYSVANTPKGKRKSNKADKEDKQYDNIKLSERDVGANRRRKSEDVKLSEKGEKLSTAKTEDVKLSEKGKKLSTVQTEDVRERKIDNGQTTK